MTTSKLLVRLASSFFCNQDSSTPRIIHQSQSFQFCPWPANCCCAIETRDRAEPAQIDHDLPIRDRDRPNSPSAIGTSCKSKRTAMRSCDAWCQQLQARVSSNYN
jgi:hypothetical protein